MARLSKNSIVVAAAGIFGLSFLQKDAFVPPPVQQRTSAPLSQVAGAAGLLGVASSAYASPIGDASKKLADASYPLISQVDWVKSPVLANWLNTGAASWDAQKVGWALKKTLDMGLAMDPKLIKASVVAHEKAVAAAATNPLGVTTAQGHQAVTESIASLIATVPPAQTKAVFDAWGDAGFIGTNSLNEAWYGSLSNVGAALNTFKAFTELQAVVRASPSKVAMSPGAYTPDYSDTLGAAAKELADAVYPIFQGINWASTPVLAKWFAENADNFKADKVVNAADATLKLSLDLDQDLVSKAVLAHSQAMQVATFQPNLVTSQAKNEAVFEAIARMLHSAPADKIKAVFDKASDVRVQELNGEWLKSVNADQAEAAFKAFQNLADAVRA
eukprot:TRINITY_DN4244_c0_g2_i1.p1 TRINITY_DN4244_c0_g2~~TRINITY_DN4244_c0_g2_i1.p1  ORF type:complete len:409 (+),score=105.83 TRINITY_DN4244_c0_g2_i1:66-1229(+)